MSDGQLLALTEEIYDAVAGGTPWAAVGKSLASLVRASNGWVCVSDRQGENTELLYRANYPDKEIAAYQTYYRYVDLWTIRTAEAIRRVAPNAPPRARTSGHLVPDAEYVRSEFYADLGRYVGLRHVVGTVVPLGAAGLMPECQNSPSAAFRDGRSTARQAGAGQRRCRGQAIVGTITPP
jgi:hypothetical protein